MCSDPKQNTNKMNNIISRSIGINLTIMQFLRLYPPEATSTLYKFQAYLLYLTFIILVPASAILYICLEKEIDAVQLNINGAYLAQAMCFVTKLLPFITNSQKIRKCINFFTDPYFSSYANKNEEIDESVRICRRNTTVFVAGVVIGVSLWNIRPLLWTGRGFPVEIWLPVDGKNDLKMYCPCYLFVAAAVTYLALAGTIVDPLIAGLACLAVGQLKVLKKKLMQLDHKNGKTYDQVKKCVKHHNLILRFVKLYEECFSWVVFSQIGASAFALCFSSLQLSTMDLCSISGVTALLCIFIVLGEVYFYCYYGTALLEENKFLADSVYMSQWYEFDIKSRKSLIILMERSKRPMAVSAGKLIDLSLETFTMILKRTYSLLAILQSYQ